MSVSNDSNIVWAADTNYRISLPNEEVRGLAEADAYDELYEADQLNHARQSRGVFKGYEEAAILFRPTYKCVFLQFPSRRLLLTPPLSAQVR